MERELIRPNTTPRRARQLAGTALNGLSTLTLVGAGTAKVLHVPALANELTSLGFGGPWVTIVGVLELTCAVTFAIPRTRALGLLLITAFLGGAIATHIQHGSPGAAGAPALVLALA